jgi:hypothetical protein
MIGVDDTLDYISVQELAKSVGDNHGHPEMKRKIN